MRAPWSQRAPLVRLAQFTSPSDRRAESKYTSYFVIMFMCVDLEWHPLAFKLNYWMFVIYREPFNVWRKRRLGGLGGACVLARHAGPRPRGDPQRHIPRVVQATAPPGAQPRGLTRLACITATHSRHTALRRHLQVTIIIKLVVL